MKKLLGFAFVAGIIFGLVEGWNWIRYRNPVEVVFTSSTLDSLPKHVTLKQIFLAPSEIVSTEGDGKPLYIPIRSSNDHSGPKAQGLHFLLKTKDPALLDAYARLGQEKSLEAGLVALKPLLAKQEVTGMLGDSLTRKQRAKLLQLLPTLAPDFSVLEEGRRPSLFFMLSLFAMSAVALFILSKLTPEPAVAAPPLSVPPAEPPPLPGQRK